MPARSRWGVPIRVRTVRRILAGEPVDRLPDQVSVAIVPRVLLDQVDQDPPQAGRLTVWGREPAQMVQATVRQRLGKRHAGALHGGPPERHELLGTVLGG